LLPQAGTLTPELQQQMQTPGYMQDLLNKVLYSLPIRWRPAGLVPPENIGQYMGNLPAGTALGLSGALNQPSLFEPGFQGGILPQQRPAGLPEGYKLPDNRQRTGWFEYPAEQIYNTMQWASQWMPGGERGVADRRTVAQQKQFQNELQAMLDWQMPAAPRPPGVPAYLGGDVTGEKNAAAMRSYQKAMAEYNLDMQRRAEAEAAWKQWMPVVQEMVAPETIQGGASYMTQPPVEQTLQGGPYRALAWQPQLSTQTARQWRFEPRWGQ